MYATILENINMTWIKVNTKIWILIVPKKNPSKKIVPENFRSALRKYSVFVCYNITSLMSFSYTDLTCLYFPTRD